MYSLNLLKITLYLNLSLPISTNLRIFMKIVSIVMPLETTCPLCFPLSNHQQYQLIGLERSMVVDFH